MSPKTAHTTCLQAEASPPLDVKEPSASHQLVPVHPSVSVTAADAQVTQLSILDLLPGNRPRLGKIRTESVGSRLNSKHLRARVP